MKLQLYNPDEKKPKKKSVTTRRKSKPKGPQLAKNYTSVEPLDIESITLPLTKLRYGIIDSHEVQAIVLPDGVTRLTDSWRELIIIMLSFVISNIKSPNDLSALLVKNNVTSPTFIVDRTYGVYSMDKTKEFHAYKIYDSGLFLESTFENHDIFNAIVGLCKICDIAIDEIKFSLISKKLLEMQKNFDILRDNESISFIDTVYDDMKAGLKLREVLIGTTRLTNDSFQIILYVFCKYVVDTYGTPIIKDFPKLSTGIVSNPAGLDEKYKFNKLANYDYYIYTDASTKGIINFIKKTMKVIEIPNNLVKFKMAKTAEHMSMEMFELMKEQELKTKK